MTNVAFINGEKEFPSVPILIAKDKNAKICIDDYKIGWYQKEDSSDNWLWLVWGSCPDLSSAIKCAKDVIKEKGKRQIYLSEKALSKELEVQNEKLDLKEINLN